MIEMNDEFEISNYSCVYKFNKAWSLTDFKNVTKIYEDKCFKSVVQFYIKRNNYVQIVHVNFILNIVYDRKGICFLCNATDRKYVIDVIDDYMFYLCRYMVGKK